MDEKRNQAAESPSAAADSVDTSNDQARTPANGAGTPADAVNPQASSPLNSQESSAVHDASHSASSMEHEQASTQPTPVTQQDGATSQAQDANSLMQSYNEAAQRSDQQQTAVAASQSGAEAQGGISDEEANQMTMEDVMAASDERLAKPPVHRGMLVTGTIIMVSQEGIVVDIGQKIEGVIPFNQISEQEFTYEDATQIDAFQPGKEIQAYVIKADIPNNSILLSKKRADQERAWNLLQDIYEKKLPVEVEIIERVKGGLVAMLGVRAFLPASQVDIRRVSDLSPYVGQRLKVRIIELNRKRNRVIISRREILEEEVAEQKAETLKQLEPGSQIDGEVVEITDFGAFVNLGGVDGLVHRSEITHGRFNHPREVLKVGDKVKVEVLDMDLEKERINLSRKSLMQDPWQSVLDNYSIGQKIAGKVTNLTQFGAFVEIEPGLEGLVHISEMSWTKRVRHPKEVVSEGEEVEAMILKIDVEQQRVSLGMRQTQPDPWSSLPDNYPPGTEVSGPITGITEFGVFIEIEEGIEGLIHISELDNKRIDDINEHFSKGDVLEAVILNIDPVEQRASLSRKRTLPYEPESYDDNRQDGRGDSGRGRGNKGGGRRGRRGQSIDYDYSYVSTDSNSRSTTKLGDVYADLFAQFGLAEGTASEEGEQDKAEASEQSQASATQSEQQQAEAASEAKEANQTEQPKTGAAAQAVQQPAEATESVEANSQADDGAKDSSQTDKAPTEDAIDAAEAAALLTAAFRQGKRPEAVVDSAGEETTEQAQAATEVPATNSASDQAMVDNSAEQHSQHATQPQVTNNTDDATGNEAGHKANSAEAATSSDATSSDNEEKRDADNS